MGIQKSVEITQWRITTGVQNEQSLVKVFKWNFMPTLRGHRWFNPKDIDAKQHASKHTYAEMKHKPETMEKKSVETSRSIHHELGYHDI